MTQPENFTSAQASDPQTPGQVLADIAALRPDLRVAVAGNPSTYPGLLEWLGGLGEPAVDAAIAARRAAVQQTQQMPTLPPTAPPAPSWAGQSAAQAPPLMVTPGYSGMPPQGGAPQYAGMPPQGGGPGLQYAGTAPQKSNKALWIVLGIVGLIILLTIGAVIFFINRAKNVVEDLNLDDITNNLTGGNYGDNDTLDALWNACEGGDWAACDQLNWDSPGGSAYESFGDTCGNRTDGSLLCVDELGGGTQTEPNAYGDDTTLDALWDACTAEDWQACDDLYVQSGVGTAYETYGDTCGNRTDGNLDCVTELGGLAGAGTYGDDPYFDGLWDLCTAEDWQACDDLYDQSDVGSGYEAYGDTCGNKYAAGTTDYCVDVMP